MTSLRTRIAVLAAGGALAATGLVTAAGPAIAAAPPRCGNASLAVTSTFSEGGAGHGWSALIYRNTTRHTCTVYGYPGLDAVDKPGHVLAHARRTLAGYGAGAKLKTVTIKPGGYASAGVEWLNFNGKTGGDCAFSAAVNTVVANTTRVHRLPMSVSACGLQVHPTTAGTPMYPDYGPAQRQWIRGDHVAAAEMGYYWAKAEAQLKAGKQYPTQVAQLAKLIKLPITGLTPKQIKQVRALIRALNAFFATPGLYA